MAREVSPIRAWGVGLAARAQARRGRHRRPGGPGHGALALPRQAARLDRDGRARPAARSLPVRSPRSARSRSAARRGWRSVAAAANEIADDLAMPVVAALGIACLGGVLRAAGAVLRARRGAACAALAAAFYRSGALVFGGGHVVLPLLRDAVVAPGWVSDNAFLAGYGAAQARAGAAVHLRRLSRRGRRRAAGRRRGRPRRPRRDLPAGHAGAGGRVAVLARVARASPGASRDARRQRRGRRPAGRRALQSGLDERRPGAGGFRGRRDWRSRCSSSGARRRSSSRCCPPRRGSLWRSGR